MNYINILENIKQSKNIAKEATNLCIVTNISLQPLFTTLLVNQFSKNGVLANIELIEYESFFATKNADTFKNADFVLVWLDLEYFYLNANDNYFLDDTSEKALNDMDLLFGDLVNYVRKLSKAEIMWMSFAGFTSRLTSILGYRFNEFVLRSNLILCNLQATHFIRLVNLEHLIAETGCKKVFDNKNLWRWNSPFTDIFYSFVSSEIYKQYLIEKGITKKCLVLDCDNVLWGGILSEDGMENLKLSGSGLGRVYQDFQRFVLSLYYHGVILAICSKNDLSDVLRIFNEHSEMILKEKHIACFQVNWKDKPGNIQEIAEKLNISLDSMVFVDDSPVEIEAVKATLPEVTTILFKRDMDYEQFACFNLKSNISIANIDKRNETYRTNGFREELKAKYTDYADYIAALEIKVDIHEAASIEFSRISELTQRTNKCTNGRRYTIAEIKERITSEAVKLYSVSVSDRFSDLGLVGAIEVESDALTLFSLSCRALGRKVEEKMIEFILDKYQIQKIEFESTGKNGELKALLEEAFSNTCLSNCENA